jgi:predicted metal-dependent phosphoesterase TrpH
MTSAQRLLLDEMFAPRIAELLAEHGIDAVAVCGHDVLEGQPDEQVLEVATKEGRCLVTENVRDFEVHRATWIEQGRDVAGLLYMSSGSYQTNRRRDRAGDRRGASSHPGGVDWLS